MFSELHVNNRDGDGCGEGDDIVISDAELAVVISSYFGISEMVNTFSVYVDDSQSD